MKKKYLTLGIFLPYYVLAQNLTILEEIPVITQGEKRSNSLNIDLQKEVHEDMKANFSKYPNLKKWGMKKTDTNIDHRRVPNLEVFFERKGKKLLVTDSAKDYKTGVIVTWMINGKLPHIGIVTHKKTSDGLRPLIVHNVGYGQVLEDCLFKYKIVGHFQYTSTISFLAQVEQWSITVRCLASVADNVNVNRINKHQITSVFSAEKTKRQ